MIPVEICHYTKKDTALDHILTEKRLRFNQIKNTNDPKETKVRAFICQCKEGETLDLNDEKEYLSELFRVHDNEWKVLCFTASRRKNNENSSPVFQKDHIQIVNSWIESELSGYNHPRMWDQYAEKHKGVCLVFDGVELDHLIHDELDDTCQIFSGVVKYGDLMTTNGTLIGCDYSDVITMGPKIAARKHFVEKDEHYFLMKNLDWERETEYRWLIHSERNGPEYVSISEALIGIIIGMDFPKTDYSILKSLCKENNIQAGRMSWANGLPFIDYNFL